MLISETLAKRMKERREELNISVNEVADQTKITKTTIYRYENGTIKNIKLPVVESIASILKVNPDWLIGKSDNKLMTLSNDPPNQMKKDARQMIHDIAEYISTEAKNYNGKPMSEEVRSMIVESLKNTIKLADIIEK